MILDARILQDPVPAGWNFEPFRTFTSTYKVGVVAESVRGISSVDIRVNGSGSTVTSTTYNSDTQDFDYNRTLTASNYSDGPVYLTALVVDGHGNSAYLRRYCINANNGGTLSTATYYVDGTNGSDSNDGSTGSPYQTLLGAYQNVYTARSAFGSSRMDGVTFKIRAGNYTVGSVNHNSYGNVSLYRPVTWKPDDGVARASVVFNATDVNAFGDRQSFNTAIMRFENISFTVPIANRANRTNYLILDNCKLTGSDRETTDFTFASFDYFYLINSRISTAKRAAQATALARGARLSQIGESAYHDPIGPVVNCGVYDHDRNGNGALHPDVYQFTADPIASGVAQLCKGLIGRSVNSFAVRVQPSGAAIALTNVDIETGGGNSFWEMERPYTSIYLRNVKSAATFSASQGTFVARQFYVVNQSLGATPSNAGVTVSTANAPGITITPSGGSALDQFETYNAGTTTQNSDLSKTFSVANPGTADLRVGAVLVLNSTTDETSTAWTLDGDPSGTISGTPGTMVLTLQGDAGVGTHSARVVVINDAWGFKEFTVTGEITASSGGGGITAILLGPEYGFGYAGAR